MTVLKSITIIIAAGLIFAGQFTVYAAETKTSKKKDSLGTTKFQQTSYALGYNMFETFEKINEVVKVDYDQVMKGFKDHLTGNPLMDEEQIKKLLAEFKRTVNENNKQLVEQRIREKKKIAKEFLEKNKSVKGMMVLDSGLQYQILQQGKGKSPTLEDKVKCHYHATTIDGKVVDSTYAQKKPAVFQVKTVIKGWVEALLLMKPGSKWKLFIPPHLSTGAQGLNRRLEPGSVLVFEVELLEVIKEEN